MPIQRLSTGIDLHYESHGTGEPLVLIPGTGFAGNVWYPSQVPDAVEDAARDHARPARLRPLVGAGGRLHDRADGVRRRGLARSPRHRSGPCARPFDGRPDRDRARARISRPRAQLDPGGGRLRPGRALGRGMRARSALPHRRRIGASLVSSSSCATKSSTPRPISPRATCASSPKKLRPSTRWSGSITPNGSRSCGS